MELIFYSIIILINITFFLNLERISNFLKIYDNPDFKRKMHKNKVPQIGGIVFYLNFCIYLIFDKIYFKNFIDLSYLVIFFSTFFIFLTGILDDKFNINAKLKTILFISIFFFSIILEKSLIINNLSFSFYETEIDIKKFSIFFTVLCFFLFINAFNMYDGINGQIGIYIIILFSYLVFKNLYFNFSIAIIITSIFFIFFNLKNKIFLGDNGSLFISFIFSLIIIYTNNKNLNIYSDEIFILMMLPGIDMARLFIVRIFNKKNPMKADNNHFHHILCRKISPQSSLMINSFLILTPIIAYTLGLSSFLIIILFLISYFSLFMYFRKN